MNFRLLTNKSTIFNRWTRNRWAVFASLNKTINIAFLSIGLTLLAMPQKSEAQSTKIAEPDTVKELEAVEVIGELTPEIYSEVSRQVQIITSSKVERASALSLNELLSKSTSVDIRQRGPAGIQADISMRGSGFDHTLILINGVVFNNIQTGHHNLDLPLNLKDIERIEILSGPAARIYGPDAFAGAVNIITKKATQNQWMLNLAGGQFGYLNASLQLDNVRNNIAQSFNLSTSSSNGYQKNTDFSNAVARYQFQWKTKKAVVNLNSFFGYKNFGAAGFYTPKYPDQFETTVKNLQSIEIQRNGKINLSIMGYYSAHYDKFELFRIEETAPTWYKNHNYHRTQNLGFQLRGFKQKKSFKTGFGANVRYSRINSNVLGKLTTDTIIPIFFKEGYMHKSDKRLNTSFFIEETYFKNNFRISAGILANLLKDTDYEFNIFPGVDISYRFSRKMKLFGSFNTGFRQPNFTDIYYQGPSNIGNQNLKPEKSINIEAGSKYSTRFLTANISLFHTTYRDRIEWARKSDSTKWQPQNVSLAKVYGIEFSAIIDLARLLKISKNSSLSIGLLTQQMNREQPESQTMYSDDYLKNKLKVELEQSIFRDLNLLCTWSYVDRNGQFLYYNTSTKTESQMKYETYNTLNIKIMYNKSRYNLYLDATNVLNRKFYDYGNIIAPGRWVVIGTNIKISY